MHKILRNFTFNSLIFFAAASGAACNMVNAKTEEPANAFNNQNSTVENQTAVNTTAQKIRQTKTSAPVTSASVAGTYTLNTVKNGVGNDNELEIENKGAGKIGIYISGSNFYKNSGNESAHETEAEGDAQLKGNVATGTISQFEDEDKCSVTITFEANQATVKLSPDCKINVALDGVYKKEKTKSAAKISSEKSSDLREIAYDKLGDFADTTRNQPGARFIIVNIPADKINKTSRADGSEDSGYKGLYYLQMNDEDTAVNNAFLTSTAMVKSLAANVSEYEPASLRATAVLVESAGGFDFYRMAFITKIEGLNEDGSVKWTATGTEPAKIKFKH